MPYYLHIGQLFSNFAKTREARELHRRLCVTPCCFPVQHGFIKSARGRDNFKLSGIKRSGYYRSSDFLELVKKSLLFLIGSVAKSNVKHILTERFVLFNIFKIRNLLIFNSPFY